MILDAAFLLTVGSFLLTVHVVRWEVQHCNCNFWLILCESVRGKSLSAITFSTRIFSVGCSFFAYSSKLPAHSGAFLLTVPNFSFFTYNWSFFAPNISFLTYSWSFFAYSGKVRLIRALRDCKQRSLTVRKKAPTVSRKASPNDFSHIIMKVCEGLKIQHCIKGSRKLFFFLSSFWEGAASSHPLLQTSFILGKKCVLRPPKTRPILLVLFSFPLPFFASKWPRSAILPF